MKRFENISAWNLVVGTLAFAALVAFGFVGPAAASVLNVNMQAPSGDVTYAGLGAAPDAAGNTYWNAMETQNISSGLLYSDGTSATGISLAVSNNMQPAVGSGTPLGPGVLNSISLFNSEWFPLTSGSTGTLTISGLTAPTYDVYVYSWFSNHNPPGWGWAPSTDSVNGSATWTSTNVGGGSSFVAGGNYYDFAGVSPISGAITVSFYTPGSLGQLAAVQLVANVPEPGTLALFACGLAGLLCYAWRKRR